VAKAEVSQQLLLTAEFEAVVRGLRAEGQENEAAVKLQKTQ
jgi:hypothetical protein